MSKKRKYHFVYAKNTKEEEFEARKNFTLMLLETIFKGKTRLVLIYGITILSVDFTLFYRGDLSLIWALTIAVPTIFITLFLLIKELGKN